MREGQSLKSADWLVGIRKAGASEFCEAMGFTSLNPSYGRNNTSGKAIGELVSIRPGSCPGQASPEPALDVVIKMELVRMGAQADGINLIFSLVV